MSRAIAVFPGTFDPITVGHVSIVQRALPLFDRIIIGMGVNTTKKTMFEQEQRLTWIRDAFRNEEKPVFAGIFPRRSFGQLWPTLPPLRSPKGTEGTSRFPNTNLINPNTQ